MSFVESLQFLILKLMIWYIVQRPDNNALLAEHIYAKIKLRTSLRTSYFNHMIMPFSSKLQTDCSSNSFNNMEMNLK